MKIITAITIFLAACMLLLLVKTAITLIRRRVAQRRYERESKNISKREKSLKQAGLKKFTFWLPVIKTKDGKEVTTRIPRHIYAPDYKTAHRQHQEDLKGTK